ncbi:MAG: heparan-alpha-glucosaminide N-acetyltransferase domain-containing protein [Spirosomaceae bacterium]|nr:heparan-alpha-glucosaminide N-acetyltransferase domain-containing protein [Spirosomataceae bacterium]
MAISSPSRLVSLDALRGFTVAAMLMVNFPGDWDHVYFTLRHTEWNGLSFTDLVAPIFLFVVGVSIAFAYDKYRLHPTDKSSVYQKIVFRALKVYALGMLLNLMPDFNFAEARWTGTLHRISIVFLVGAFIFLHTNWRQQAWIAAFILVGYWLAMTLIPTPGVGRVMLEPGVNLAAWMDSQYLPGKMWQGTWDPEGILSTFPSIATSITDLAKNLKANYLMAAGVVSAAIGYFWGLIFPVNENLWTSSFVLVTSGFAALLWGVLYLWTDILGKTNGMKLGLVFGANAIAAYVLGDVLALVFYNLKIGEHSLNHHAVQALMGMGIENKLASWWYALFFVGVNFIPVYWLYQKKIFIKL